MEINYYQNTVFNKYSLSYNIMNNDGTEIGTAEGYCNVYGDLVTVIKIFSHQQKGIGFRSFEKIYNELNSKVHIKRLKASWSSGYEFETFPDSMSTNLKIFQDCMANESNADKCAFSTPTGKWALKIGFNKITYISISKEEVIVDFEKQ